MKANIINIGSLLTKNHSFEVLPFQRPYVWNSDKGNSLWENLWGRYTGDGENYYLGSVFAVESANENHFKIIDGQQRLIAITIMLCGVRDLISDPTLLNKLQFVPFISGIVGDSASVRITVKPQDQDFFNNYILEGLKFEEYIYKDLKAKGDISKINLIENVKDFKNWCNLDEPTESDIIGFTNFILDNVLVTFITEKSDQSAIQLYKDINENPYEEPTNMSLSESDQIKVFLYNKMKSTDGVEEVFESFWNQLEEYCGIENLDEFFSFHLSTVCQEEYDDSISLKYKEILSDDSNDFSEFRTKMSRSALNYQRIWNNEFDEVSTQRAINSLNRVNHSEWKRPLLAFLNNQPDDGYDIKEFVSDLEKITYQMWILEIKRDERDEIYNELLLNIVNSVRGSEIRRIFRKHHQNEKFGEVIHDARVFEKPYRLAVLLRLEEYDQDESVTKTYGDNITIEHVLPQNLSKKYWGDKFDKEYHEEWVHCLGNLVLLSGSKNSQAQDSDFKTKKKVYNELSSKVSFDTTKSLLEYEDWDQDSLDERHDILVEKAKAIWSIEVN